MTIFLIDEVVNSSHRLVHVEVLEGFEVLVEVEVEVFRPSSLEHTVNRGPNDRLKAPRDEVCSTLAGKVGGRLNNSNYADDGGLEVRSPSRLFKTNSNLVKCLRAKRFSSSDTYPQVSEDFLDECCWRGCILSANCGWSGIN